jgi:hypothetical protein
MHYYITNSGVSIVKILIRTNQREKWEHLKHTEYSGEAHLQDILYHDPDVIPVEDIFSGTEPAPIRLMLKEVELSGSGYVNLIYIIETKLAKNPEVKREVIGQVLEYAAFLQDKEVDWLEEITEKQTQFTLAHHFEKERDWDRESFMQNLQDNLKNGAFKLFIVVDETNPALQKTINRMNSHGEEIYTLELKYFNNNGTEILVPGVHAGKIQKEMINKSRGYWTEEKYFEEAEKSLADEVARQTLRRLYAFSRQIGIVDFGAGRSVGTFRLHLQYKNSSEKLYVISYNPQFSWFAFREMLHHGVNKELISDYIKKLKTLGFQLDETTDAERDPQLDISVLNDPEKFEAFKKYSIRLKEKFSQVG